MRLQLEEKDKRLIKGPIRELRNTAELIANVRNIQRLEADRNKGEMVDICHVLEEIKKEYEHLPGREAGITLSQECTGPMYASNLLKDAFGNIVSNAIKHATGPVQIGIVSRPEPHEGIAHIRVSIEDNGPGIPDELKERVFERSMRGDTKVTGQGLGLYLVKRLVEDQDGKVWVVDRIAGDHTKGARFVVLLRTAPAVAS